MAALASFAAALECSDSCESISACRLDIAAAAAFCARASSGEDEAASSSRRRRRADADSRSFRVAPSRSPAAQFSDCSASPRSCTHSKLSSASSAAAASAFVLRDPPPPPLLAERRFSFARGALGLVLCFRGDGVPDEMTGCCDPWVSRVVVAAALSGTRRTALTAFWRC